MAHGAVMAGLWHTGVRRPGRLLRFRGLGRLGELYRLGRLGRGFLGDRHVDLICELREDQL